MRSSVSFDQAGEDRSGRAAGSDAISCTMKHRACKGEVLRVGRVDDEKPPVPVSDGEQLPLDASPDAIRIGQGAGLHLALQLEEA